MVENRPQTKAPLSKLWAITAGQRLRYAAAIVSMAVGTIFLLLVPYILKLALDAMDAGRATLWGVLIPAAAGIVVCHVLHGFFVYFRGRWAAQASEGVIRGLRHQLFAHLEELPCAYHDKADTGDLVQRCSSDVETLRMFLSTQIVEIARVSLFLLVAVPIMFWQSAWMSLLSLALFPVIIAFAATFFRKVRKLFQQVDEAEGRLTTVLQENLTGIRVVRAFTRQQFEIEKFAEQNDKFRDLEFRLFVALSNYWGLSDLLVFAQIGLVLIGGGYFVLVGSISLGTWMLFFWLLRTIIWPIRHFGRVLADSGKATIAIGRILEILTVPAESEEPVPKEPICGDIEVRNLTFSYGDSRPALDGLTLSIGEGESVALLGPPGAGKSTLVNLLVRLYDYDEGSITIGGRELRTLNRAAVREAFGMVLQDPFLYSKTVRENVVLGRSSAADHEVEETAQAADIHKNIVEFEHGYDTMVGERGVTLSGGQRQRLAIARALLKNPRLLVLDDSLSAVDTQTEAHILQALSSRRGKQTTILIAHRLSSTRLADRIFVLDQGRLVQQGTHEELVRGEGTYARLWKIQGLLEEEIQRDLSEAPHE
jgi:ATP-binding cassette subfamily B protein